MKKVTTKLIVLLLSISFLLGALYTVCASNLNIENISKEDIKDFLREETTIEPEDATLAELLVMYDELTEKYTNQDIANIIDENKTEIMKEAGIDGEILDTATDVLRSLDTETTKQILKEDLNVEEIQEKLEQGYTVNEIAKDIENSLSTSDQIRIGFKLMWASSLIRISLITSLVLGIYMIIVRWIMFRKAGRHGWAAIIPIYNDVTYLKVCGLSPWLLLLLLVPVIGWIILALVGIIARFTLAKSFGKGVGFGIGLLFLNIIFESIIAFSKNIEYVGEE